MTEASKARLTYVDIGKGLGMMMIVWMHIWGNNAYGFTPPHLLNWNICKIYVPLFFVLSGYLISVDVEDYKAAVMKKVKSILRPFAVMYVLSFVASFILSLLGIGSKHAFAWTNFFNPLLSKTFFNGPLWFLLALFWAFFLLFTIIKACRGKVLLLILVSVAIGCVGFYLGRMKVTLPLFMGQGFVGCPMLIIGYLIKKYIGRHFLGNKLLTFGMAVVGLLLFVAFSSSLSMQDNAYDGMYPLFLLGVTGGSVMFISLSVLLEKYLPFAAYWGRYSLVVLCLHNFILIPVTQVVAKFIHLSAVWAITTFIIVYLAFLVVIPLVIKFAPSLFNIKKK